LTLNPHLSAVHFRINMAGQAAEHAVEMFAINRPDAGAGYLKEIISDLQHCVVYLETSGQYSELLAQIKSLISFYTTQITKINGNGLRLLTRFTDPKVSVQVGNAIYLHQGYLLAADPYPALLLGF